MRAPSRIAALLLSIGTATAALGAAARPAQDPDARPIVAAMRQALGGAVLDAVRAFTVTGSLVRDLDGHRMDSRVEIFYEAPDKFVKRTTMRAGGGGPVPAWDVVTREGVNGDLDIFEQFYVGAPFAMPPLPAVRAKTPADALAAAARRLLLRKQSMARQIVPLFAASPPGWPLTFVHTGQQTISGATADAVDVRSGADVAFTMYVDAKTRLPVMISWMGRPIVISQTTSSMRVTSRGEMVSPPASPMFPSGDPTAGMPDVRHERALGGYRTDDGLTWPTQIVDRVDGKVFEDMRLGRFRINPKINPDVFKVPK